MLTIDHATIHHFLYVLGLALFPGSTNELDFNYNNMLAGIWNLVSFFNLRHSQILCRFKPDSGSFRLRPSIKTAINPPHAIHYIPNLQHRGNVRLLDNTTQRTDGHPQQGPRCGSWSLLPLEDRSHHSWSYLLYKLVYYKVFTETIFL